MLPTRTAHKSAINPRKINPMDSGQIVFIELLRTFLHIPIQPAARPNHRPSAYRVRTVFADLHVADDTARPDAIANFGATKKQSIEN